MTWIAALRTLIVAAAAVASCCSPAPSKAQNERGGSWAEMATANRHSDAVGAGVTLGWNGADGQPVSVAVVAPRLAGRPVEAIAPAAGDNGPAIRAALEKLPASGGGTLRLAPGTYRVAASSPAVMLEGLNDVLIDGRGARIVFATWGDGFMIRNAARIAIKGLSLGYAQPAVIAATVRRTGSGNQLELDPGQRDLPGRAIAYQVTGYDRASGTALPGGRRLLLGRGGAALNPAAGGRLTLASATLDQFADGDAVEIKLAYYKGAAIRIADTDKPVTHDVTIDGVTVSDSAGAAIAVDLMGRGLAVLNSRIGVRTGRSSIVTIAYDALHVTAMTGDILLRDNVFTASGDDAINLGSPIFDVATGGGATTLATKTGGVYPGAELAFFDSGLRWLGNARISERGPRDAANRMKVSLDAPLPAGTRYARNMALLASRYAVVGNDVSRCQCHGLLVQGPNGLVRENRFAGLRANAIRLVVSAWWHEGSGAQNVVVERNQVRDTGDDGRRGVVWAAITAYGELGDGGGQNQPPVARQPLNGGLLIRDNDIAQVAQGCISIASSADVRLSGNRCAAVNQALDRGQLMVERSDAAAGLRRMPAKTAYLASGDGVWIDPLSTTDVRVDGAAR
ncbi:hypothetical protein J2Y58_003801 [Sphingomonas sp. BE138]|uniref:hypothetical protein n=1 Tax=Sphingomonas sp. BE138 TaxID=2817845 RepID=UPI002864705B|nr:hypothetical protein [Sphingomonas sp. BE138]MDR6790418.1 hypothetical protein [Sphingomonas sp. BE138]